jgi:IgGFc binding protein
MTRTQLFWICGAIGLGCADAQATSDAGVGNDGGLDVVVQQDSALAFDATGDVLMGAGCSGDLRNVLDGQGNVIGTCSSDEGCAGGQCVAACDAAGASKGSLGCDYVVATPSFDAAIAPPCFAMFITNGWPADAQITVTRAGQSYDVTKFGRIPQVGMPETSWAPVPSTGLPAGQVAVLFLSHDPASLFGISLKDPNYLTCPIEPAIDQTYGTAITGSGDQVNITGRGAAWHVSTTVPVTSYDILPYGGAHSALPSAELLFPTTAWTSNYLAVVPTRGSSGPQWGQILGAVDGTQVTVYPNVDLPSGTGVVAAPANTKTTYTLATGEYVQWQESNDMSGTIISATQPVAFMGGQAYACYKDLTSLGGGCDSTHQQVLPVSALGNAYAAAPYTTRRKDLAPESVPYRFVGVVGGTTLTYDPAVTGAPSTLSSGQVVDFETTSAFVVRSQDSSHPFYVAQRMTGEEVTSGSRPGCTPSVSNGCALGDEEYVNVLPPAQFLSSYVFFTDPTYATTNLVFVRQKSASGFSDVTLDCAGVLTGWTPMDGADDYEMTNIDLLRATVPNGSCNNGPHTATSGAPFGITVWGLDSFASYAYPAGGNIAPINSVVVQPPN